MKQQCQRCKHEWNYTGEKGNKEYPEFVTCPICMTSVKLKKTKEMIGNE